MALTPNGFWYPDGRTDTFNTLSGLFSQQASSADAALDNRILLDGIPKFLDSTGLDAAYADVEPARDSLPP